MQAPRQGSFKSFPIPQGQPQGEEYTEGPPARKPGFFIGVAIAIVLGVFIIIGIIVIVVVMIGFLTPVQQTTNTTILNMKASDSPVLASEKGNASSFEAGEQMICLKHTGGEMRTWDQYVIWIIKDNNTVKVRAQILTISGKPYHTGLQSGIDDVLVIGVKDTKDNGVIRYNDMVHVEITKNGIIVYLSGTFVVK